MTDLLSGFCAAIPSFFCNKRPRTVEQCVERHGVANEGMRLKGGQVGVFGFDSTIDATL